MTLHLDTRDLPSADRGDAVRETIANTVVHVDIDFPEVAGPAVRGAITDLGDLRICSIDSNAVKVERTSRLSRDDQPPSIFLAIQTAGSSLIVQDGREAVLGPGDLAFSLSTSAYTLLDADGIRQHFFSIPVAALALPHDAVRRLAAVTLSPGHPVADLASAYFQRLAARPDIFAEPGADLIGRPSVELVRALLATHLDDTRTVKSSAEATLALRIMEYTRMHLADPDLTVAQVAAAHNISVRQLYTVLGREGISLGEWVREARLEACRALLGREDARRLTIAAIGRRCGFANASSFTRLFRRRYGMSPGEWRINSPRQMTTMSRPG
jgi:AraC-like DNA-binding protein